MKTIQVLDDDDIILPQDWVAVISDGWGSVSGISWRRAIDEMPAWIGKSIRNYNSGGGPNLNRAKAIIRTDSLPNRFVLAGPKSISLFP